MSKRYRGAGRCGEFSLKGPSGRQPTCPSKHPQLTNAKCMQNRTKENQNSQLPCLGFRKDGRSNSWAPLMPASPKTNKRKKGDK